MEYLPRTVDLELDRLLAVAPAVAIDGPKAVGKTGTAQRRANSQWYLDDPAQRAVAAADFELSTPPEGTHLIDEWQQLPQVWDAVRRSVDAGAPPGRYLLTGSATPVNAEGTHSGAGRILSLRMRPMALHERGILTPTVSLAQMLAGQKPDITGEADFDLNDYLLAIVQSGFPGIMNRPRELRTQFLDAYLQRVVDRDLPEQGFEARHPDILRRWLAAYAAASSSTTSYSKMLTATTAGDGPQPAKTTTAIYREHLTKLWLLEPVPGWVPSGGMLKRVQQSPKHQLADPALAARLLNLSETTLAGPREASMVGPLFESLATLSVRVAAQAAYANVSHMRLRGGDREIDLIVEDLDGNIVAVEVKFARTITDHDVRHLLWLREQMPDYVMDLMVLCTAPFAYRRPDGVAVVPLALLGP